MSDEASRDELEQNWQRAYEEWRENGQPLMLLEGYPKPQRAPGWARVTLGLIVWSAIGALVLWWGVSALSDMMKAPERERRQEACVAAMYNGDGSGPVKACEGLSDEEKRQASYEYLKRLGWL